MKRTQIENGVIWHQQTFIRDHTLIIESGKITDIVPTNQTEDDTQDVRIDAQGCYALPGFVDVHIHGSDGFDTMDASEDALSGMFEFLVSQGVTSVLPTTMSDTGENITQAIETLAQFATQPHSPHAGIHLEGPYLNPAHRGSQPDTHLRPPQRDEYLKWFQSGQIKLITIAPELAGGDQLMRDACEHGITVSIGHSGATYEQTHHALNLSLSQFTHTFNGIIGIHHREPGALVAAFESPNMTFQIIPDGVHVHPAMVSLLVRLVGTERIVVITDAMRAAGLPDGHYPLGDVAVTVKEGQARAENGSLAGSTLTMPNALHNMMDFCNLSLEETIPMLTSVPAQSIGLSNKGTLAIGTDADLILWDVDEGVQMTLIDGEIVYQK